jgi:hypothetical protein
MWNMNHLWMNYLLNLFKWWYSTSMLICSRALLSFGGPTDWNYTLTAWSQLHFFASAQVASWTTKHGEESIHKYDTIVWHILGIKIHLPAFTNRFGVTRGPRGDPSVLINSHVWQLPLWPWPWDGKVHFFVQLPAAKDGANSGCGTTGSNHVPHIICCTVLCTCLEVFTIKIINRTSISSKFLFLLNLYIQVSNNFQLPNVFPNRSTKTSLTAHNRPPRGWPHVVNHGGKELADIARIAPKSSALGRDGGIKR